MMQPLDMACMDLVTMKDGHPHCIRHGAMNAVGCYDEKGVTHFIWRCVTTYRFNPDDLHLPVEQRRINENPCRAGCLTIKEELKNTRDGRGIGERIGKWLCAHGFHKWQNKALANVRCQRVHCGIYYYTGKK